MWFHISINEAESKKWTSRQKQVEKGAKKTAENVR